MGGHASPRLSAFVLSECLSGLLAKQMVESILLLLLAGWPGAGVDSPESPDTANNSAATSALYEPPLTRLPTIPMSHIGTAEGLPALETYDIAQDRQGFIWVTTNGGVFRFDAHDFRSFGRKPNDPNALPATGTRAIVFDRQSRPWVATDQVGLNVLALRSNTVIPIDLGSSSLNEGRVNRLVVDRSGFIWAGLPDFGLARVDPETFEVELFQPDASNPNSLPDKNVRALHVDSAGVVWVGTQAGLARIDSGRDDLTRISLGPGRESDPRSNIIEAIHQGSDGRLYVGNIDGELVVLEPDGSNPRTAPLDSRHGHGKVEGRIFFIETDRNGRLWVGASGITVFDLSNGGGVVIEHDPARPQSLGDNSAQSFFQDRTGVIWIGHLGGISTQDPRDAQFGDVLAEIRNMGGAKASWPWAVMEDSRGGVWIGTDQGIWRYDRLRQSVREFSEGPASQGGLTSTFAVSFLESRDGAIWIGTYAKGVNRLDPASGSVEHYSLCFEGSLHPSCNQAFSLLEDREGVVWAGSALGLRRFDPSIRQFRVVESTDDAANAALESAIRALAVRDDGGLWIGTESGLVLFDGRSRWSLLTHKRGRHDSLSNQNVTTLLSSNDGGVWAGTYAGLNRVSREGRLVERLFDSEDIPSTSITIALRGKDGAIWLGTEGGIVRFDPESGDTRWYTPSDGLPEEGFLTAAGHSGISGQMYFPSIDRLISIDPAALTSDPIPPAPVLTSIAIADDELVVDPKDPDALLKQPVEWTDELSIPYARHALAFRFAGLHYSSPEAVSYAYQLEGFDNDWRYSDADNRVATYTALPWGRYRFRVKASNPDGVWSPEKELIQLTILPPWWATWWAYVLYIATAVLAVALFVSARTRAARLSAAHLESEVVARTAEVESQRQTIAYQAERLEHLLEIKNRLFADLSHELRTPLTLIAGPVADAIERTNDDQTRQGLTAAHRSANRLARLVDQLLDLARLDAGQAISREPQPIGAIVESQLRAFEPLAASRGVRLEAGLIEGVWVACGPDPLEKILSNLLSNAIKFTPEGGHVQVGVQAHRPEFVSLIIEDTGVGIPDDLHETVFDRFERGVTRGEQIPGAGIGLALVKELVEACGGEIRLRSESNQGTSITVMLPAAEPQQIDGTTLRPASATDQELRALVPVAESGEQLCVTEDAPALLICEDNNELRSYLPTVLGDEYAYELAADGETALEFAQKSVPDLLICDAMLPGISGFEVCHQLKGDPRTSHIPVLILTARADDQSRLEGYRQRADDYLTKPFSNDELRLRVANLLEARKSLRERYAQSLFLESGEIVELAGPDRTFLESLDSAVSARFRDAGFNQEELAKTMNLSPRQLQRKTKALTDNTPAAYVRKFRLAAAKRRLEARDPVGRIALDVGFSSQTYFARCFKEQYGVTPSCCRSTVKENQKEHS